MRTKLEEQKARLKAADDKFMEIMSQIPYINNMMDKIN